MLASPWSSLVELRERQKTRWNLSNKGQHPDAHKSAIFFRRSLSTTSFTLRAHDRVQVGKDIRQQTAPAFAQDCWCVLKQETDHNSANGLWLDRKRPQANTHSGNWHWRRLLSVTGSDSLPPETTGIHSEGVGVL